MLFRTLGKTGLRVSVLGLGTGSRFGRLEGSATAADRIALVRTALDLGLNYFDTAAAYGDAEAFLGRALAGVPRGDYGVATKFCPVLADGMKPAGMDAAPITPADLRLSVEASLRRLQVGMIDILQIHGLRPHWREPVMAALGDELERLQAEGKFRFLGVTETLVDDPRHKMVPAFAPDPRLATACLAYSLLSPWAELEALPACQEHGVGAVAMVAVRRALSDPAHLAAVVAAARAAGETILDRRPASASLDWLLGPHTPTLAAAGYQYVLAHPAIASVLAGTLNPDHLRANVLAACAPPLSAERVARIRDVFLRTDPTRWRTAGL